MATILPNQVPPITVPFLDNQGRVEKDWWLFFYNIGQSVLGNSSSSASAFAAQLNADLDADIDQTDTLGLIARVANLERQVSDALPEPIDVRALLLAQDGLLPDPTPRAQPTTTVAVGASPFSYTAPFDGQVTITGGTVSAIAISRDGTTFVGVGFTTGVIPVSRSDVTRITHTGAPTMTFFPR